jgi:phage virion morphogenesis protein
MLTIDIDNAEVLKKLEQLSHKMDDMTPVLESIGEHIASEIDLCFTDARDPNGVSWEDLSDVTIARRRNGSDKPLNDTGRLKNSITSNVIDNKTVEIGTNVEYAITHQKGATKGQYGTTSRGAPIPWGNVPARPFIPENGLPNDWEQGVLDQIAGYLEP